VECTAISLDLLGAEFDVQAGGRDLAFPHHPMCAAESQVVTGRPMAKVFLHAGMVGLDGEKMSKSRGNLVFVSRLRADGVDPMALRLALVADHYRSDRQWTDDALKQGEQRLARWRAAVAVASGPSGADLLAGVRARLSDDLDTPGALALVDSWADAALAGYDGDRAAPGLVRDTVDALLGVRL
jgi:L-cysteine:1D-myo-inositol 2-amino-2-deoxy-alpha-D-glucopyranoside ligase